MLPHDACLAELISFIHTSPTAFHAAAASAALLAGQGFVRLDEQECWGRLPAGKYYVLRNESSLIGFTWQGTAAAFSIIGAHTDSPGLRLKPNALRREQGCLQLGVEIYGGALLRPWFDRELSLAGRVAWQDKDGGLRSALLDFQRPVGIMPSLAIHLNREANKQQEINGQTEMVPLVGLAGDTAIDFQQILREQLCRQQPEAEPVGIIDHELFFYDATPPALAGLHQEFLVSARLDNLVSCFAATQALRTADSGDNCLIILNDHEEVGSVSATGAKGPFLRDVLERLLPEAENRQAVLRKSFFISADNAHAVHPNYTAKHDPQHLPQLGRGPVIKFNANQRYATTAASGARFRQLCAQAKVPAQDFVSRSDLACGSTIGPLTAAGIGVDTVDVGIPSLAMHSIRETAACIDCRHLCRVLTRFFQHG
jgi:aspartyl aminopeptidase